jgi:transcriptional regulator with XRE-family HTH domain
VADTEEDRVRLMQSLARERVRQGVSQGALSARCGIATSALSRLETGRADPRPATISRYAAGLGLRLRYQLEPIAPPEAVRELKPAA